MHVKLYMESGVSVNARGPQGYTPLVAAMHLTDEKKRRKMFNYLMKSGANFLDVDRGSTRRDVLAWACYLGRMYEIDCLMAKMEGVFGLLRPDRDERTSLHYAVLRNDATTVKKLCEAVTRFNGSVDVYDSVGFTPYLYALKLGYTVCEQILLEVGKANPNQSDRVHGLAASQWKEIGGQKDAYVVRRKIAAYKAFGRLAQLKASGFDPDQVKVVQSSLEKATLEQINSCRINNYSSSNSDSSNSSISSNINSSNNMNINSNNNNNSNSNSNNKNNNINSNNNNNSPNTKIPEEIFFPVLQKSVGVPRKHSPFDSAYTVSNNRSHIDGVAMNRSLQDNLPALNQSQTSSLDGNINGSVLKRRRKLKEAKQKNKNSILKSDMSRIDTDSSFTLDNRGSELMRSFYNLLEIWSRSRLETLRPDAKQVIQQKVLLEEQQKREADMQKLRQSRRASSLATAILTSSRDGRRLSTFAPQALSNNIQPRRHSTAVAGNVGQDRSGSSQNNSRPPSRDLFGTIPEEAAI